MNKQYILKAAILGVLCNLFAVQAPCLAELGSYGSLGEEQAHEKKELEDMKGEMNDIKSITTGAVDQLSKLNTQSLQQPKEFHLVCKEVPVEIMPGLRINCLTYNGRVPGPVIRVREGEMVRVILHNQMKVPTSLHFHGMSLPQSVDGLPRREGGLVKMGDTYNYQFVAPAPGTYWYHPQLVHGDEKTRGLYGAIVVEGKESGSKSGDEDFVMVLGDCYATSSDAPQPKLSVKGAMPLHSGKAATAQADAEPQTESRGWTAVAPSKYEAFSGTKRIFNLINGQSAPAIPPIEVTEGSRVRMRLINGGQQLIPLHISGHRFDVTSFNGDSTPALTNRDTLSLAPGERADIEFTADNPGVWSFGSEVYEQTNNDGHFPGGIACVMRYVEKK
jgi:FtsP/CotA-like multicopper oxidase with cupredoxin domain